MLVALVVWVAVGYDIYDRAIMRPPMIASDLDDDLATEPLETADGARVIHTIGFDYLPMSPLEKGWRHPPHDGLYATNCRH